MIWISEFLFLWIVSLAYVANFYELYQSNYLIPFNQSIKQLNDEIYVAIFIPNMSNDLAFNAISWALDIINNSSVILKRQKLKAIYTLTEVCSIIDKADLF